MQIVIVAAGVGKRLRPLTNKLPKCMVEVKGKPLIEHQIEIFKKQGFEDILFCLGYLADKVWLHFLKGLSTGTNIKYSVEPNIIEDVQLTGTAGAVKHAEELLDDEFIVFYGDIITELDFNKLIEFHKKKEARVTMVVRPKRKKAFSSLILKDDKKAVTTLVEKPSEEEKKEYEDVTGYENNSIYVMDKSILSFIEPRKKVDFMRDVFPKLVGRGLYAYVSRDKYWELGRKEKIEEFEKR